MSDNRGHRPPTPNLLPHPSLPHSHLDCYNGATRIHMIYITKAIHVIHDFLGHGTDISSANPPICCRFRERPLSSTQLLFLSALFKHPLNLFSSSPLSVNPPAQPSLGSHLVVFRCLCSVVSTPGGPPLSAPIW